MDVQYYSQQPIDDFGLPFSKIKYDTILTTAGGEQTLTVPSSYDRFKAIFSYADAGEVWVASNATATVAGASFAATDSELNPRCREVNKGDVLHFITADTSIEIGVSFYPVI